MINSSLFSGEKAFFHLDAGGVPEVELYEQLVEALRAEEAKLDQALAERQEQLGHLGKILRSWK